MIKLLKCKKGVTLMELLVGMMLCTMIVISATGVMLPVMGVISNVNDFSECNSLLGNLASHMTSDLYQSIAPPSDLYSQNIVTVNGAVTIKYEVNEDGILCKDGVPVFGEAYYKNKTVGFVVSLGVNDVYILKMTIYSKNGNAVLTEDYAVKPFMLSVA